MVHVTFKRPAFSLFMRIVFPPVLTGAHRPTISLDASFKLRIGESPRAFSQKAPNKIPHWGLSGLPAVIVFKELKVVQPFLPLLL